MSDALDRIEQYAHDFSEGIDRCRPAVLFKAADYQDAYNRLSRLRDRYCHEKNARQLDRHELPPLRQVFEEDAFIEDMLKVARQIGEHVHVREPQTIRLLTNANIPIGVETSALAFFGAAVVNMPDEQGRIHVIDHVEHLREAEMRITRALDRARHRPPSR